MISRSLYLQILVRILILVTASLGLAWIIFSPAANILVLVPVVLLFMVLHNTVFYLNRMNRRIFFLFEALKNEDSSMTFPDAGHSQIEKDLSRSLQEVNQHIQNITEGNKKQEQYFQALMEHAATGMFTYNTKGFILHSNNQARQLLGLEPFTHISQLEAVDRHLLQAVEEIHPGQQHLTALHMEEGVVQLLIKASAFRSDGEEFMLLSVHDIRNELDEREIDSWRKLIRVMRHEIMNSVTPITSLSESLSGYFHVDGRVKTPAEIDEKTITTTLSGLDLIHDQAKGLIRFVESYKQLTRMPEPEKRSFPVGKLLDNICMLARSFEHADKTELICDKGLDDLELLADEQQISQVLINLVKNAFQATQGAENARIEISTGSEKNGSPWIRISDNGPGIPYDLMDKVFIPFFTTKEKGSGIGLSLSRQIMQMHGGSLKIHSVPGKQTSVVIGF